MIVRACNIGDGEAKMFRGLQLDANNGSFLPFSAFCTNGWSENLCHSLYGTLTHTKRDGADLDIDVDLLP